MLPASASTLRLKKQPLGLIEQAGIGNCDAHAPESHLMSTASLIATTGPVFASQSAYATTAAGIGWSIVLLGEHIPLWTWAALGLIIVGLIMVALGRLGDAIADADNGN
jgi:hypothetical protein